MVKNELLKNHTTFQIGGPADTFVEPESVADLGKLLKELNAAGEDYFILGGGSNLVFSDEGFRGTIISTGKINRIAMIGEDLVIAEAGVTMKDLVDFCSGKGLSGLEEFAGLPGTVGGALFMNARCFDKSISDVLHETHWLEKRGDVYETCGIEYEKDQTSWDYKKSPFQHPENERVILSGTFKVKVAETAEEFVGIKAKCDSYIKNREEKGHFKYPSAGSVFKNNHAFGKPSGKIIDEAGLRGYSIGDAQVAPFHGNIIINLGNATADDVKKLVLYIQNQVQQKFSFDLENEIIFVDEKKR